jgi:hypothetical protein
LSTVWCPSIVLLGEIYVSVVKTRLNYAGVDLGAGVEVGLLFSPRRRSARIAEVTSQPDCARSLLHHPRTQNVNAARQGGKVGARYTR